jgi:cell shape-determining protein MreC
MKSRGRNNGIVRGPVAWAAVLALVLLFLQIAFPRALASVFSYFFSPLWSAGTAAGSDLTPRTQLIAEIQALQQQADLYEDEASSSKALADENAELKALMGRSDGAKSLLLASVLKTPPGAGYDYLILDVGSVDGVSSGDKVYAAGNISIGQIVEADPHTAKAELYSSPGASYDVLIGQEHIPATAIGQGGGSFSASVSREAGVAEGDEVIVPGISSSVFGDVASVISDPAQPFARVLFEEPIDPYQLRFVLVDTGPATGGFLGMPAQAGAAPVAVASSTAPSKTKK